MVHDACKCKSYLVCIIALVYIRGIIGDDVSHKNSACEVRRLGETTVMIKGEESFTSLTTRTCTKYSEHVYTEILDGMSGTSQTTYKLGGFGSNFECLHCVRVAQLECDVYMAHISRQEEGPQSVKAHTDEMNTAPQSNTEPAQEHVDHSGNTDEGSIAKHLEVLSTLLVHNTSEHTLVWGVRVSGIAKDVNVEEQWVTVWKHADEACAMSSCLACFRRDIDSRRWHHTHRWDHPTRP